MALDFTSDLVTCFTGSVSLPLSGNLLPLLATSRVLTEDFEDSLGFTPSFAASVDDFVVLLLASDFEPPGVPFDWSSLLVGLGCSVTGFDVLESCVAPLVPITDLVGSILLLVTDGLLGGSNIKVGSSRHFIPRVLEMGFDFDCSCVPTVAEAPFGFSVTAAGVLRGLADLTPVRCN